MQRSGAQRSTALRSVAHFKGLVSMRGWPSWLGSTFLACCCHDAAYDLRAGACVQASEGMLAANVLHIYWTCSRRSCQSRRRCCWHPLCLLLQGAIATKGEGLYEGLDWLSTTLKQMNRGAPPGPARK